MKYALALLLGVAVLTVKGDVLEARLDNHVLGHVAQDQFSGAVLVAKDGKPILRRGYGLANHEWNLANSPVTKFRLGSVTKQFTAALVFKLQEQGKLDISDLVSTHMQDSPAAWEKVTIFHLLTHNSGIPNFTSFPEYPKTMHAPSPPAETLKRFRDLPLDFEPGSKFSYSNSGYVLLGYLLERISGHTYAELLHDYIFAPLEMKDSGYDLPGTVLKWRASGYSGPDVNAAFIDMSIPHAAGALYSTVDDLLRWDQGLYSDRVLSEASRAKMFAPSHADYACGWLVKTNGAQTILSHGGGINGFVSHIARIPEERLTVILLANNGTAKVGLLGEQLARIALGESVEPPRERVEQKIAPELFDAYAGRYELVPGFILRFWREGDVFWTQATGQNSARIYAESESKFFLKVVDAQVTFVKGPDGKVSHLLLHQNGEQQARRLADL